MRRNGQQIPRRASALASANCLPMCRLVCVAKAKTGIEARGQTVPPTFSIKLGFVPQLTATAVWWAANFDDATLSLSLSQRLWQLANTAVH